MANKYQHDVPAELKPGFDANRVRVADYSLARLTHAEKVKTLLTKNKSGVLSTVAEEDGTPFGSIINFALDEQDTIFFFASKLAEHTSNLLKDNHASLFVYEEKEGKDGDQLAVARATILGKLTKVEKSQQLMDVFLARHPNAHYVRYDDFSIFMFSTVTRVRYIAGFGEMSWIGAEAYHEAKSDQVLIGSAFAVQHMNADHAEANVDMVNHFGGLEKKCTAAQMFSIDRLGMDILASIEGEGKKMVRIMFPEPLETAKQIREVVVKMAKEAEAGKAPAEVPA